MSNTTNVYVSRPAWLLVPKWAPATVYASGSYIRNQNPPLYVGWAGNDSPGVQQATANFGGSSFLMSAPSGFSAWGAADTWNPSDKNANVTLSNGNLTANLTSGGNWFGVRSILGKATGKWYFEITMDILHGGTVQTFGMASKSWNLNSQWLAQDTTTSGGYMESGSWSTTYPWQGVTATHTVGIAIDIDAQLIWARTDVNGNWNNSALADPATGVGGDSMSSFSNLSIGSERVFKSGGLTSGSTEPAWNLGNNATTSDNGGTWTQVGGQEAQQLPGNWQAPLADVGVAQTLLNGGTGNVLFVSDDHSQTYASDPSIGAGNVQAYISVSRAVSGTSIPPSDQDYSPGASLHVSGGNNFTIKAGNWFGFTFEDGVGSSSNINMNLGGGTNGNLYMEDCQLQMSSTGGSCVFFIGSNGSFPGGVELVDTTFKFGAAGQAIQVGADIFEWRDVTGKYAIDNSGSIPNSLFSGTPAGWGGAPTRIHGLDLSNLSTRLFPNNGYPNMPFDMYDSKLHASLTFPNGLNPDALGYMKISNCDVAGGANYKFSWYFGSGQIFSNNDAARVGGASDGTQGYCWNYELASYGVLRGDWISKRYNTTGVAKTVTMHAILFSSHLTVLPDTLTAYMEVEVLDDVSGSPLCSLHSTRATLPWGSAIGVAVPNTADLTADWTAGGNTVARSNSHAYVAGALIKLASNPGRLFLCLGGGTSAGSEPGAYATAVDGQQIADGSTTFQAGWRVKFSVSVTPEVAGVMRARVIGALGFEYYVQTFQMLVDPIIEVT